MSWFDFGEYWRRNDGVWVIFGWRFGSRAGGYGGYEREEGLGD